MSGVVALDKFDPEGSKYMRKLFPDIIEPGTSSHETWPEHAVGLLVAKSHVTADTIRHVKKLKFIVRHGTGYDNIDVDACKKRGVVVCNCPGISAMSVAEVVLALTGACAKNLIEVSRQIRAGEKLNKTFKSLYSAGLLTSKTYGIIGGGAIGQLVAKKFIGAYDGRIIIRAASVEDMLPEVDVLSLHVPLLSATKDLITLPDLRTMKPTAILINTSRGGVVNETDLWVALTEELIAAAGVDAWNSEPPTREVYGNTLDLENLVITPHIGGSPAEVQTATCRAMCDRMREMIDGRTPRDRVA